MTIPIDPEMNSKESIRAVTIAALAVFAFAILAHLPVLFGQFLWDDVSLIQKNPSLNDLGNIPKYFVTDFGQFSLMPRDIGIYRPLQSLVFALEWKVFGDNPAAFHFILLLIHGLAALAVFFVAKKLGFSLWSAFMAGALFAVLPAGSEAIHFISNQGGAMAAAFTLWALWAFVAGAATSNKKLYLLSLFLFALGLFSKETAIVLPALIIVTTLFFFRVKFYNGSLSKKLFMIGAGHWIAALLYIIWRYGILKIYATAPWVEGGIKTAILSVPLFFLRYLRICLLPFGLGPEHEVSFVSSFSDVTFFLSWLGLAFLALAVFFIAKKVPAFAYGILLFAFSILPMLNLIPLARPFAEHYLFLPSFGFCIALIALADRQRSWRNYAFIIIALLVVLYASVSLFTATYWKNDCALWKRGYKVAPNSNRAINKFGTCLFERGKYNDAEALFRKALKKDPVNYKAYYNLAIISIKGQNWRLAAAMIEKTMMLKPDDINAAMAAGVVGYHGRLQREEFISWMKRLTPLWEQSVKIYDSEKKKWEKVDASQP